jgi:hypothetical protein
MVVEPVEEEEESVEYQLGFQRNISPPSSGSKNKQSKKPSAFTLVSCSTDYTALYPRRWFTSTAFYLGCASP